jgi:hypothetical protein
MRRSWGWVIVRRRKGLDEVRGSAAACGAVEAKGVRVARLRVCIARTAQPPFVVGSLSVMRRGSGWTLYARASGLGVGYGSDGAGKIGVGVDCVVCGWGGYGYEVG